MCIFAHAHMRFIGIIPAFQHWSCLFFLLFKLYDYYFLSLCSFQTPFNSHYAHVKTFLLVSDFFSSSFYSFRANQYLVFICASFFRTITVIKPIGTGMFSSKKSKCKLTCISRIVKKKSEWRKAMC